MRGLSDQDRTAVDWLSQSPLPEIRFLTARDLSGAGAAKARALALDIYTTGATAHILRHMNPAGYWVKPGAGYTPKYKGTVWSLIALSQIGAAATADKRIDTACRYLLDHTLTEAGQFSTNGSASGTADCLQGNLCAALLDLGIEDPRLEKAFDWMARSVTGEGIASMQEKNAPVRYYAGKCGPCFACGANNKLPCAWGAAKVMLALSKLPAKKRTGLTDRAIRVGVDFFLGIDPLTAEYPCGWAVKPSSNWWKFGFPVFYVTDTLQIAEVFAGLGMLKDKRLKHLLEYIRSKQQPDGSWLLEYDYTGKTWTNFGAKKQPNPWVTLRAARVIKEANA
jgi:hypothetical protein